MAHVLVVDDQSVLRELIKDLLAMEGHTCDEAANGFEALERLRVTRYDLVVMDRTMPKMTGIQALQMIRANPKHAALKVIICTSSTISGDVDEAFAAGANDYVLKPINMQTLAAKVRKQIGA